MGDILDALGLGAKKPEPEPKKEPVKPSDKPVNPMDAAIVAAITDETHDIKPGRSCRCPACDGRHPDKPAQGTRLLKTTCPKCGYVIRVTKKWADEGLPLCSRCSVRSRGSVCFELK